jgi:hypothetical protein
MFGAPGRMITKLSAVFKTNDEQYANAGQVSIYHKEMLHAEQGSKWTRSVFYAQTRISYH